MCKLYSIDLNTGEVNTIEVEDGSRLPILRHGTPTPCESCPKKSPENGERLKLTERNQRALDFYSRAHAMAGMQSELFQCPTTQRNFIVIDNAIERAKADYSEKLRKQMESENVD